MNWRTAFFLQARNDYAIFREFKGRSDVAMCQKLHYLQMATEKLAKAFLSPMTGETPPPAQHKVLVRFLRLSKGRPEIRRQLGYAQDYRAYCSYVDSLLDIAQRIEDLAPVGTAQQINPEYPWSDFSGAVLAPAEYSFPEFDRHAVTAFQSLTDGLFRIFKDV